MPYGYTRTSGLRGTGRTANKRGGRRNKGTRSVSKVKWQKPSAFNQRKQIMNNRRSINMLASKVNRHLTYTDWQMPGEFSPSLVNNGWACQLLMAPLQWNSVMRGDPVVSRSTSTYIKRMQINGFVSLNQADYLYLSIFIVTPRREVAGRSFDPVDPIAADPPVLNVDYIESNAEPGRGIRLNPSVFKVHDAHYITLTKNGLGLAPAANNAGNPFTTYRKFQVNKPLGFKCSVPSYTTGPGATPNWHSRRFEEFPYYQKYQILTYASWGGTGEITPTFVTDPLFTCINTD